MPVPKFVQSRKTTLKTSISASETTSIVLKDLKDIYGNALSMSDFETTLYLTFEPASDNEEIVSCTGFTVNSDGSVTLDTGIVRGLSAKSPYSTGGTARTHAAGVVVIAGSNHPQLYDSMLDFLVNLEDAQTVAGKKTFSTVPDTTGGDPTGDNDLARKAYVDSVVGGIAITNAVKVAGNAGETVAAGQLVYFDYTDDEWKLCDADTAATVENVFLGVAQGAGTDGNPISGGVLLQGVDDNQSGLTAGNLLYAGNTAGEISESVGTTEVTLGIAYDADSIYFNPRFDQQITEDQQDALAGTSGTPSNTNKYVTADDVSDAAVSGKIVRATGTALPALSAENLTNLQITQTLFAGEAISEREAVILKDITEAYADGAADQQVASGSSTQYVAQGFQLPATTTINRVTLSLKLNNTPTTDLTLHIYSDSAGEPNASVGSATARYEWLTSSYTDINFAFDTAVSITADTQYWLVLTRSDNGSDGTDYYQWESDAAGTYSYGNVYTSSDAATWSASAAQNLNFAVYYKGVMLADADGTDINGVPVLIADEAISARSSGKCIQYGIKTGFSFGDLDPSETNAYNNTTTSTSHTTALNGSMGAYWWISGDYTRLSEFRIKPYISGGTVDGTCTTTLYVNGVQVDQDVRTCNSLGTGGTDITFYPNVAIRRGEYISAVTTQSGGSVQGLGYMNQGTGTSQHWSTTSAGAYTNKSINATIVVKDALAGPIIGETAYVSDTAGALVAQGGGAAVGQVIANDSILVGDLPSMSYISSATANAAIVGTVNNGYASVPTGTNVIVIKASCGTASDSDVISGDIILDRNGKTTGTINVAGDGTVAATATATWTPANNLLVMSYGGGTVSTGTATVYFYR